MVTEDDDGDGVDSVESGDHFRGASVSDGVLTIDRESTIRYANPAIEAHLGYDPADLVGEPLTTVIPADLARRHVAGLDAYLDTGERTVDWEYLELRAEHADGHTVPLAVSFGEFSLDGEQFFTGVVRGVSERSDLEVERRRQQMLLERIVETTPVGVIVVDEDIDPSNTQEVLFALTSRCDPAEDIDVVRGVPSMELDARITPENKRDGDLTTSSMLVDACKPYHWRDEYPPTNKLTEEHRLEVVEEWNLDDWP